MKTLVLCVDRDDDFGVKAGLNSPFVGREENLKAAIGLGLKDAEDSDTNTLLAAISLYDEMIKKGMYAGNIVELTSNQEIFKEPLHPYTQGLLSAIPRIDQELPRLEIIEGSVPNLSKPPAGCRFHPRCPYAMRPSDRTSYPPPTP